MGISPIAWQTRALYIFRAGVGKQNTNIIGSRNLIKSTGCNRRRVIERKGCEDSSIEAMQELLWDIKAESIKEAEKAISKLSYIQFLFPNFYLLCEYITYI